MKTKTFDKQFDAGVDMAATLGLSKARRVLQEQKRVNVDFPKWMIASQDREAEKFGVTRQSIIKVWLAERPEKSTSQKSPPGPRETNPRNAGKFGRCTHTTMQVRANSIVADFLMGFALFTILRSRGNAVPVSTRTVYLGAPAAVVIVAPRLRGLLSSLRSALPAN